MGDDHSPALSIGLPVYNGERHVEDAVKSLLAQSYTDFELFICDNASTDRTGEICCDYAAQDDRIRYHRNEHNVGAGPNFNLAFELTSAPFFKWAAHDDICLPEYLESCMHAMRDDAGVVLCHSEVELIDDEGAVIRSHDENLDDTTSNDPAVRFRNLILSDHWCTDVFGVMRRDVLAATPLIASYVGSDRALLTELGLHGRYYRVPRPLFQNRDHARRSVHSTDIRSAERVAWFDPSLRRGSPAPMLRCWYEYLRSVNRLSLSPGTRMRCYSALFRWLVAYRWAVKKDVKSLVRHFGSCMKRRGTNGKTTA